MKTILIIEDDLSQLGVLKTKLTPTYRVLTALEAKIGWNILLKEHPDLLLLDIMLPGGMNGFDLLQQLKNDATVKDIPVIVLTNLDTEETTMRNIGVADYLVKANTTMDAIAAKIDRLLTISK